MEGDARETDRRAEGAATASKPCATNQSQVCASQAQVKENRSKGASKRKKTMKASNRNLELGMAASMEPWTSPEWRKLLDAVEAHGKRAWQRVADDVGSRTATQCESQYANLKKLGYLVPITEDTPLRKKVFPGFGKPALKKFAKCVAEIDGKRITTVGQLAKLDLVDDIEYLMKLTGYKSFAAVEQAGPWIAKAAEALAFWK